MPFRYNALTGKFDLVDESPAGAGDVFHVDPLTAGKIVIGAGADFITVSGIDVDGSDNVSNINTISVNDIPTTQQNLDLEPGVDIQIWSAILDQLALLTPAEGDMIVGNGTPEWSILSAGGEGEVLTIVGGVPSWSSGGSGDVVGPASSTDNALVRWNGVTGKLIQNSVGILTDAGAMSGLVSVAVTGFIQTPEIIPPPLTNLNINAETNFDVRFNLGDDIGVNTFDINNNSGVNVFRVDSFGVVTNGAWQGDVIAETFGGTGQSTYTTGDILYSPSANTLDKLAIGAEGEVLKVVSGIPSWEPASGGSDPLKIGFSNIALTYSAGTATFKGADGNDWSAGNPGKITLPSNVTPSTLIEVELTTNKTFDDANGTSIFTGSLFGFLTGDDTNAGGGNPIPFFIYASLDNTDSNPIFWVSRIPNHKTFTTSQVFNAGSGSADFGRSGLTLESVTVGNYEGSSCILIGTFDASLNGSDDWVVENVENFAYDLGIGRFAQKVRIFPRGVMGARTGSYFIDNGGTAPTINTNTQATYLIDLSGRFHWDISLMITGSPAGDVEARLIRPLVGFVGTTLNCIGTWASEIAGMHVNKDLIAVESVGAGGATEHFFFNKCDGSATRMQYSEIAANDILRVQISYNL